MQKNTIDSPVPDYNGGKGPGDALNLPTKVYPSSTKMATNGKGNTIDGPASKKQA